MQQNNQSKKVLLKITDLKQWFPIKKTKLFQKEQLYVRANDGITPVSYTHLYIKMGDYTGITKAVCVIMNRNDEKQTAKEKIHGLSLIHI